VWVIGGAEATYTDGYTTFDPPWFPGQGHSVRRSGDVAFAQAGVSRDDIDVAVQHPLRHPARPVHRRGRPAAARRVRRAAGPGARIGLSLAQGASVHGYAGTLIMAID
jgi:hypothetical protein